jgi:hypothetical protein
MYNFNYEYMTFLYAVRVYMFCNVVLYCIALPARVLFEIKIIIILLYMYKVFKSIIKHLNDLNIISFERTKFHDNHTSNFVHK